MTASPDYLQHLPVIVRYLRRRLGDAGAEDAAADVYLRALSQSATEVTLPWLYGAAANVIAERRREERRRLSALERLARQNAHTSALGVDGALVDAGLIAALRGLNDGDRDCLLLLAWGELSYEEVAAALDIPLGTVRSRIARARRALHGPAKTARAGRQTNTRPNEGPA